MRKAERVDEIHQRSQTTTTLYLSTSMIGIGYLYLPSLCNKSGLGLIIFTLLCFLFLSNYSFRLIINAHNKYPGSRSLDELAGHFLGKNIGYIFGSVIFILRGLTCLLYISQCGDLLWHSLRFGFNLNESWKIWVEVSTKAVIMILIYFFFFIKSLHQTKFISILAHFFLLFFLVVLLIQYPERKSLIPSESEYNYFVVFNSDIFTSLSECMFMVMYQTTVIYIFRSFDYHPTMQQKKKL